MIIFIGGPSGTGKTTIGRDISNLLSGNYTFIEGDDLHPPSNKQKMIDGIPLTDEDRWPWLKVLTEAAKNLESGNAVVSCSMLKVKYREFIRNEIPSVAMILLTNTFETIYKRMKQRKNHFFKASMLQSQYKDFEPRQEKESNVISIQCGERSVDDVTNEIYKLLKDDFNLS